MKNVSGNNCRDNQNTHSMLNIFLNCTVCEIMWKNIIDLDTSQMTVGRICISCWITKATDTHIHKICSTYCFSTTTMVGGTWFIVTLCVHCQSLFKFLLFGAVRYIHSVVLGRYFSCRVFICRYLVNITIYNCYYSIPAFLFQTHFWSFHHF